MKRLLLGEGSGGWRVTVSQAPSDMCETVSSWIRSERMPRLWFHCSGTHYIWEAADLSLSLPHSSLPVPTPRSSDPSPSLKSVKIYFKNLKREFILLENSENEKLTDHEDIVTSDTWRAE